MATNEGSITFWISQLKDGDDQALGRICERYWPYLVNLARKKMGGMKRRASDEEDVALDAFMDFYNAVKEERAPDLLNRDDLLSLLIVITARKAANQFKYDNRQKRGGGHVAGESIFDRMNNSSADLGQQNIQGPWQSPSEQPIMDDLFDHYVTSLPEKLRPFAEHYLAGLTYPEIAEQVGCVERTVERKIPLIREIWQEMAGPELQEV